MGVPFIAKSLADRGHQAILLIGGRINPGLEGFVQADLPAGFKPIDPQGRLAVLSLPSFGTWAFAPSLLWRGGICARNADFIGLHSLYSFPVFIGFLLARLYRKPYGLWPHGVLLSPQRRISARLKRVYDWLIARHVLNGASVLVFSSALERDDASVLGLAPPSVVIPHGFDAAGFEALPPRGEFRRKYLDSHSGPLVLYLSRLNAKKGLDLLAHAFALVATELPDARLAIVGASDPPRFESRVRAWFQDTGADAKTTMVGLLLGQEKLQAFADADVFVLPSEAENFGFAMFEAMASRVPIVVSDTLDYAADIRRGNAGFVVPRDPREVSKAIVTLLRDADLRQRMGANGARLARTYSWHSVGEQTERTILNILAGRRPSSD